MIALGLDLSLTGTGWAILDTNTGQLTAGTIVTKPGPIEPRLQYILDQMPYRADLAAIEGIGFGIKGAALTERAGLHYMTRHRLWRNQVPFGVVNVQHLKQYATGLTKEVTKTQMVDAIHRRLGLDRCPRFEDDNQVDAAWLALMAGARLGHPVVQLPAAQRAVLGKVAWPDLLSDDLAAV